MLGLVIFAFCRRKYGKAGEFEPNAAACGVFEEPDVAERARMDREYLIWKVVVGVACFAGVFLYALPFLCR